MCISVQNNRLEVSHEYSMVTLCELFLSLLITRSTHTLHVLASHTRTLKYQYCTIQLDWPSDIPSISLFIAHFAPERGKQRMLAEKCYNEIHLFILKHSCLNLIGAKLCLPTGYLILITSLSLSWYCCAILLNLVLVLKPFVFVSNKLPSWGS